MELFYKLITLYISVTLTSAQLNYDNPTLIPEYIQTQSSYVEALQPPSSDTSEEIPETTNFNIQQLPKPDPPAPFYTPESPIAILEAPKEDAVIANFNTQPYQVPAVPAQELQIPPLSQWNPNNDPSLYYPVVVDKAVPVALNIPTGLYPKKYSKSFQKVKPSALKIKELQEFDDEESAVRQKQADKVLYALAKKENKKLLELEKLAEEQESLKVLDPIPAASFAEFSSSSPAHGSVSSGGFIHDALAHAVAGGHGGDRMEFQIRGHDGPKSYKWGFDTGKGHNRHFRYEEMDKHGVVKGHYGYYDKHGKLRITHYDAQPHGADEKSEHH